MARKTLAQSAHTSLTFDDLVDAHQILASLPFSKASLYNWSHGGSFPSPIKTGRSRYRWRRSDVDQWLTERGLEPLPSREACHA